MGIKLVSLNIERAKHLERVEPFLLEQAADVVCLQELLERDIPRVERVAGKLVGYMPVGLHPADPPDSGAVMTGVGIFSRTYVERVQKRYYRGSETAARTDEPRSVFESLALIAADVQHANTSFRVATTHFEWTPVGGPSDRQREAFVSLNSVLDELDEHVLCGDFNAPRGGEIFSKFADRYTDNIPEHYVWSIDLQLHRAGPSGKIRRDADALGLPGLMVDGLFSTPAYQASNVRLHDGVSDHLAIVAEISKG